MEYYEVLTCATLVIAALAMALWVRTRDFSVILGIAVLYYWSLYGAWFLITDKLGGSSGRLYGYLEAKMFAISLDENYFKTLVYYGVFIIAVELALLFLVKPAPPRQATGRPLWVSHGYLLLFATSAGLVSYLLIRPYISEALQIGLSGYKATRDSSPYFSIHQVLNRAALIVVAIGFATLCSDERPRLIAAERRHSTIAAYIAVIGGLFSFNFVLGNKNEPLNAGLVACLLYIYNSRRLRVLSLVAAVTAGMSGLWLIDHFRAYPLAEVAQQFASLDFSSLLGDSYGLVNASNEPFAAHFSMYGALAYHIVPVFGQSFVSLAASMVPRLLWEARPADVYTYYAASVGAISGQGYTIHHATGWYLNFGAAGVPLGGITLGCVWGGCLNAYRNRARAASPWGLAFRTLAPWLFVAFLPNLIRAGIESYKALAFEGLLIPVTVVALAGWRRKRSVARSTVAEPAVSLGSRRGLGSARAAARAGLAPDRQTPPPAPGLQTS